MNKINLKKRVVEILASQPETKFKARDLAQLFVERYPEAARAKLASSGSLETEAQLLNQIVAEIGANRPSWQKAYAQLRTTEGSRPRLYYWTSRSEEQEIADAERDGEKLSGPSPVVVDELAPSASGSVERIRESDLYPMLIDFMRSDSGVHAFRIDEKTSSNVHGSGANRWLFPDVVGMESLTADLHPEVISVVRESGDARLRLWSFEVKLLVNRSNAREAYFQAVSNSSWANFGYLVCSEFEGVDTLKELRILYAMHGIGLIRLDSSNPSESQVIVPARERPSLEWAMCSRLASVNSDFNKFMKKVRHFYQTGDLAV